MLEDLIRTKNRQLSSAMGLPGDYVIARIHPEASFTPNSSQVSGVLSTVSQNFQTSGLLRPYNPPTEKQAEPLNVI